VNPQHTEIGKSRYDVSQYRRLQFIYAGRVVEHDRGLRQKPPVGGAERSFALYTSSPRQVCPVSEAHGEASCA
jgi:hypothetical protein